MEKAHMTNENDVERLKRECNLLPNKEPRTATEMGMCERRINQVIDHLTASGRLAGWMPEGAVFDIGDTVFKVRGSCWQGKIVGFYSTKLTPIGYAVESDSEHGSVQIYPEAALALAPLPPAPSEED